MMEEFKELTTEQSESSSEHFSSLSIKDAVLLMNREDERCIEAVRNQADNIARVTEMAAETLKNGGRLVYMGAGTSGRLGMLDAVECPPTFGVADDVVIGLVAGGECSFSHPREDAEDSCQEGVDDLKRIGLSDKDMVVGVAASGRTPYVIGGIEYAKTIGARTAAIACAENSKLSCHTDTIELVTGAEVLTGSTRLKAGTACKMAMNMISTIAMKEQGHVYKNYMVDVQASNEKLRHRAVNIVCAVTGCPEEKAAEVLALSANDVKTAIVMIEKNTDCESARTLIDQASGFLDRIL